jgi:hemolysin activation/secretion protein
MLVISFFFCLQTRIRRRAPMVALGVALLAALTLAGRSRADEETTAPFFIQDYLVEGVTQLPPIAVEKAVYPFLGPERTARDVEKARAAVEEAYHKRGYQTVQVTIPSQPTGLTVRLIVLEVPVGRLRVRGAQYSSPTRLKSLAPSLAEGKVIDFNQVSGDMVALNQLPGRQVTPSVRSGVNPGTVDVDLEVKEKSPVHASAELNNRRSSGTTPLRLTVAVSDGNIAQSGNAAGLTYQTSPQASSEVRVFSAYYLARFPALDGIGFQLQGTKQDSNVSTLGSVAVAGRGQTVGLRVNFDLPSDTAFVQSASAGVDYKNFDQTVNLAATATAPASVLVTPIKYYPLSANYAATWTAKHSSTEANAGLTFHVRGMGGNSAQFLNNRYGADGNFIVFHSDFSHEHDLPGGFQVFGKVLGQIADQPLISNEQLSGGGVGTARGYLEAEALGDSGVFGTVELRSPSLLGLLGRTKGDWRFYGFYDAGRLTVDQPLPDQASRFSFASYGIGTRLQLFDHFDGSVAVAFPRTSVGQTTIKTVRTSFRADVSY